MDHDQPAESTPSPEHDNAPTAEGENAGDGSPLLEAVSEGNDDKVRSLLAEGADPTAVFGRFEQTLLHVACSRGHTEVAIALMEAGLSPAAEDDLGVTPLHVAAENGLISVVEFALDAGAERVGSDHRGRTPLHIAALNGHRDMLELLLEAGYAAGETDAEGDSPLHLAIRQDHLEITRLLLKQGDRSPPERGSLLYKASTSGNEEIIRLVLEKEGRFDESTWASALAQAAERGNLGAARVLLEEGADPGRMDTEGRLPLVNAAARGHVEIVELLLQEGADPTQKGATAPPAFEETDWADKNRLTPLVAAARKGATDVVEMLLGQGADPTQATEEVRTPLHGAARSGSVEAIELLLEEGADPIQADSEGKAPIHEAARSGSVEATRRLVEAGADPTRNTWTKGDESGETRLTPAYSAVQYVPPRDSDPDDSVETLRFVVERGANVNCTDPHGQSPIYFCKNWKVARLMIDAGIDIGHRDQNGWTPLHKAARKRDSAVTSLLLQAGADPNVTNDAGDTPVDLAEKGTYGEQETVIKMIRAQMET